MQIRSHNTLTAILFYLLLIFFASCKKEKSGALSPQEEEQVSVASSESDAQSEIIFDALFDDVFGVDNQVGLAGTGIFGGRSTNGVNISGLRVDTIRCFTLTKTNLSSTAQDPFPLKIVIDFGGGCTDHNGHSRSGKIITIYTGRLIVPGKSATTTFDNYKIDNISVSGTYQITNTSSSNQRQFTVDVKGKLSNPNGDFSEWISHKVITQIEGL